MAHVEQSTLTGLHFFGWPISGYFVNYSALFVLGGASHSAVFTETHKRKDKGEKRSLLCYKLPNSKFKKGRRKVILTFIISQIHNL